MLYLKRVQCFNECEKDCSTNELITWGHYYYEDDEDGFIISLENYNKLLERKRAAEFDYSRLEFAKTEREYRRELKKAEEALFMGSLFKRQIAGRGGINSDETK